MSDIFDEDVDNEEMIFAQRDWDKFNEMLDKDGYRDGVPEGREKALQDSFNSGYCASFQPLFTISNLNGITDALTCCYKCDNEEMSARLNSIKTELIALKSKIDEHLLITDHLQSNSITFPDNIIELFNEIKSNLIIICNQLKLERILDVINPLTLTQINQ